MDNTQEALQAYRRATGLDPDNADGWNNLGHLLACVGDLGEAIAAYS
ncbi:tetratricopeptide repeat protein [Methyloglobulus sp.]